MNVGKGVDTRKTIAIEKCNECNKKNLIVYSDGVYHCGNCYAGGLLLAFEPMKEKFQYLNLLKRKDIMDKIENSYIHGGAFVLGHIEEAIDIHGAFNELKKISPKKAGFSMNNSDINPNKYGVKLWNLEGKWYSSKSTLVESIIDVINKFKNT